MTTAAQCILALGAAGGLLSLLWLAFGHLLAPASNSAQPIIAVLPVKEDAIALEQTVHHLLWLQGGRLARFTIVIVDQGLTQEGLRQVQALRARESSLFLCTPQELSQFVEKDAT